MQMNKTSYNAIAVLMAFLLIGCATGSDSGSPSAVKTTAGTGHDSAEQDAAESLREALHEAVTDRSQWDSLHLLVRCTGDEGTRSAEVYGNGVGIWNDRRQFTLTPAEVSSLIEMLDEADYASFADVYGGSKPSDPQPRKEKFGPCCPLQVVCNVELLFAGATKRAAQIGKGEQSAELKQLAEDLLDACEKPGQAGTVAVDLADGLEKVAGGVLAPETLSVMLHRKAEQGTDADNSGFLLRVSGGLATSRRYDAAGRLLDPVSLMLGPAEVATLARELREPRLAELPLNLFAQDYKDLSIEVLNHRKSIQARRFDGITATTHADDQAEFEQIYNSLLELHLRVLSAGD